MSLGWGVGGKGDKLSFVVVPSGTESCLGLPLSTDFPPLSLNPVKLTSPKWGFPKEGSRFPRARCLFLSAAALRCKSLLSVQHRDLYSDSLEADELLCTFLQRFPSVLNPRLGAPRPSFLFSCS